MNPFKGIAIISIVLNFMACAPNESGSKAHNDPEYALGEVHFTVSGNAEAQPSFEKGLLLLHSFEYEDAREAFQEAQDIDPDFGMAYWGEAMTYNHSLWQRQEKDKALEVLERFGETEEERLGKVPTEIEKEFFRAIHLLYGEGTKYERDVAYRDFMAQLSKKYPNNHEISAFYAISLLGSSRNGRDAELYEQSARIAQGIIQENPNHPGALHYLIHSYDDPDHAFMAHKAADSYARVAPDAAHALHMPSHIYVALGRWNDVVNSNIASWNASIRRMEKKHLDNDAKSYHAFNWLQYGFLQRGEIESAEATLRDMMRYVEEEPSKVARSYMVSMKGAQLVETDTWNSEFADIQIETADLNIVKRAGNALIDGMTAVKTGDLEAARSIHKKMATDIYKAELRVGESGFAMCSAGGYANKPPDQLDVDMAWIMAYELEALLESAEGRKDAAEALFKKACAMDETLSYSYGPPSILKPIHEAYADWLLRHDRPEEALQMFNASLERHPRRLISLRGKQTAAEMLGDADIAREVEGELAVSLAKRERVPVL